VSVPDAYPTPKQSAGLPAATHPAGKFLYTYVRNSKLTVF
jgi:hypothetical protein